jgi:hypothetical protein
VSRARLHAALAALLAASPAASAAFAANPSPASVTVAPNSERPCYGERQPAYLNVDFIVGNRTARDVALEEMRGYVLSPDGEVLERRIVWQQALAMAGLGPGGTVAAGRQGLIFNPLHFNSARPGLRIRYEFDFSGEAPVAVTVVPRSCATRTRLILPVAGRVSVLDGHDMLSHHRRFNYLADWAHAEGLIDNPQRFAIDLVLVDSAGRRFRSDGRSNSDFLGWEHPVRAPGAGIVVGVHDGQPDNDRVGSENLWHGRTWVSANGNYVMIDHGHGEFSLIAHMRQGSVRVHSGQRVRAGDIIGAVGNSGSSLMPHVHYELQTGASNAAAGLPAYFHDLRVLGTGETGGRTGVVIDSGDIIVAR